MLESSEQVRPLTVESPFPYNKKTAAAAAAAAAANTRPNRYIKCCGCIAAILLIQSAIAVLLAFTVFKLRPPIVRIEKLTLRNLQLINGSSNITLNAAVWLKNPNYAALKYGNMTTTVFYRGAVVGEVRGPPGRANAHRTVSVNITLDIMTDRILTQPGFDSDFSSGLVNVSSYTRVGGRMNLFLLGKRMVMKMKCNMSINITSNAVQHHKCKRKLKL